MRPVEQLRAGHRPAELIPDGMHPAAVTIVLPAARSYVGLSLLVLAASVGAVALVLAFAQLAIAAAPFAGVSAGGITLALRKGK